MKKYFAALDNYAANRSPESREEVQRCLSAVYSKIDKAVKRGVLHRNNGARKKARLAKSFKQKEMAAATS